MNTELFQFLRAQRGSDLHLSAGTAPRVRIHGALCPVDAPASTSEDITALVHELLTPAAMSPVASNIGLLSGEERLQQFEQTGDLDFVCELRLPPCATDTEPTARYRVNCFRQRRGLSVVFRAIPKRVPTLAELGLSDQTQELLQNLALLPKGLVLVTGPTGCGKSTTLAAIIDHANTVRHDHILTIEDPVEFIHTPRTCLINQREVGQDSLSFGAALRGALREDPDIILVGEMRDRETISLALEAAETGHLVFATLHTASAPKAIDRIIQVFPPEEQTQIRTGLSESLQAVLAQTLFCRADQEGRLPALEIMLGTPAVRNLIRENKIFQLPSVLQTSHAVGMQTLDDDIERLIRLHHITPDVAKLHLKDKNRLDD
ncbi:MAG: type IV pilus twitching motility protein PilT [Bilophila sp.]